MPVRPELWNRWRIADLRTPIAGWSAKWIPKFDLILTASEEDRARIQHPNVHVYPNALPVMDVPV